MGYNTSVLILNDNLHEIEKDQEFGKKVSRAVSGLRFGEPKIIFPQTTIVETHHASGYSVVAFGENNATVLSPSVFPYGNEDFKLKLLRELADQMGFRLRKKQLRGPYNDASFHK